MVWTRPEWTKAACSADVGIKVPDGLMSFASSSRGKPSNDQRTLYLGAVAFTYAVWENYVEDLALEMADTIAPEIEPSKVPEAAKTMITAEATAWEMSVHPGWRGLWVNRVRVEAKGDESIGRWGLNTASVRNVSTLFRSIGLDPVPERVSAPMNGNKPLPTPPRMSVRSYDNTVHVDTVLKALIDLRGEAVHTAQTKDKLLKNEVHWWRSFVITLYEATDQRALRQCEELLVP